MTFFSMLSSSPKWRTPGLSIQNGTMTIVVTTHGGRAITTNNSLYPNASESEEIKKRFINTWETHLFVKICFFLLFFVFRFRIEESECFLQQIKSMACLIHICVFWLGFCDQWTRKCFLDICEDSSCDVPEDTKLTDVWLAVP